MSSYLCVDLLGSDIVGHQQHGHVQERAGHDVRPREQNVPKTTQAASHHVRQCHGLKHNKIFTFTPENDRSDTLRACFSTW